MNKGARTWAQYLRALVRSAVTLPAFHDDVTKVGQSINAHGNAVHKQGLGVGNSCSSHLHHGDRSEEDCCENPGF